LAQLIAAQSALAGVQVAQSRSGAVSSGATAGAGASARVFRVASGSLSLGALPLRGGANFSLAPSPLVGSGRVSIPAVPAFAALDPSVSPANPESPVPAPAELPVSQALAVLSSPEVGRAVEGLHRASPDNARGSADAQFAILTGERRVISSDEPPAASVAVYPKAGGLAPLRPAAAPGPRPAASLSPDTASEKNKGSFGEVFKNPERNRAFWRYLAGSVTFLFGFKMYIFGLPYYISGLAENTLRENHDPRAGNAGAISALVRENRSLARIAHWTAQAFSYATAPLFSRSADGGPKKWLVRSYLIRAGVLTLIPTLFFASGFFSVGTSFLALYGLIAVHSYFQGVSVTSEGASTTRIMGDPEVTQEERNKANSYMTVATAILSIFGPLLGGQIARVKNLFGKASPSGAIIYGIYALVCGLAGLIFATVGLIGKKNSREAAAGSSAALTQSIPSGQTTAPLSLGRTFKNLWFSFRQGLGLVLKDRFLRTMLILSLIAGLFADPLIFNILPEYVKGVVAANPGALGAVMRIPGLGWFLDALTKTPMGYFALMSAGTQLGRMLGSLVSKPLRRLLITLGFKSEESLTIPFYVMAALEAPLFWLMIFSPSLWVVLGLYAFQAFMAVFSELATTGFYQKTLGSYSDKPEDSPEAKGKINKILAAQSLMGIIVAIISTYVYGFVLGGIPIATSLLIAGIATSVLGIVRLVAPWLFFSKEQRGPKATPIK